MVNSLGVKMEYCIRFAKAGDHESILSLMKEHALFEGHKIEVSQQHQQLINLETLPITIFVVESNNKLLGYMSVVKQFSTWDMDWYMYLDCLYLSKEIRGQGIGFKLMDKLRTFSRVNKIRTIQWQTPKENSHAIEFYQKLDTDNKEKRRFFWGV